METTVLTLRTGGRETVQDLTGDCEQFVRGRGDGLLHVFVPHASLPVLDGRLALGTWQSVALVDLNVDNPDRTVRLSFLAG